VTFSWWQLEWYEDEWVVVHARDPHHRVDTLHGSPRVQALAGGRVVVDSVQPLVLFETIPADPLPMPKLTLPTATADPAAVTSASAPGRCRNPQLGVRLRLLTCGQVASGRSRGLRSWSPERPKADPEARISPLTCVGAAGFEPATP
jgi:hypothetical protein